MREDELLNTALKAAGIEGKAGARTPLRPQPPAYESERVYDPTVSEEDIQKIADAFIRDAEKNGLTYSDDARLLLLDQIRKNPDNYLH